MVTIGMHYDVLEGKGDVFERAFDSVLEVLSGMDGHQDSRLYRDVSNPQSYLIASEWNDTSAFEAFVGSEQFAKVTNWGQEQVLAGPPKHQVYGG